MKNYTLFTLALLFAATMVKAQVSHTISVSGFTYSPSDLVVNVGDTVIFDGSDVHPILEVSEETWNANGKTALSGGFSFPNGTGKITFDTAGVHYYVCTAHVASQGMKGKITVSGPTVLNDISDAAPSVYPLPLTGNELTVSFRKTVQKHLDIFIYDLAGNLRITESGYTNDGMYKVDCSKLPRGMFLLKMNSGGENSVTKIVRE